MKTVFINTFLVILGSMLFIQYAMGPLVINKFAEYCLHAKATAYYRHLAQGVYYMMEEDLLRFPESQRADRIKTLQSRFGYGISLKSYKNLALSKTQISLLHKGLIVVIGEGRYLYKQVGAGDLVLAMGPFSKEDRISLNVQLYIWLLITVILVPVTLLWIIPYWQRLRKISSTAIAFGNGDLNVRADVSARSSLAPIAIAFNSMAERIQQLITSHKDLTNDVSHELRTPISRIRFGLEMLKSSADPQKKEYYFDGLAADVNELEELVTELLTFARLNREKPELHFCVQNLESWLSQLMSESMPVENSARIQLFFNLDSGSYQVNFEPKYMARALGNLIQNGLCYSKSSLFITVEQEGDDCCIHIDDDGPGVPSKDWEKIFEPFARLDTSRDRATGGYGLGLAIVSRILAWHNGQISVGDSPLGGARFTLRWPGFVAD